LFTKTLKETTVPHTEPWCFLVGRKRKTKILVGIFFDCVSHV